MDWEPIETAPQDGTVFLAYHGRHPQFVAWIDLPPTQTFRSPGLFRRPVLVEEREERGWRVLMPPARGYDWGVYGNFAPFNPTHWMPLPEPPQ